MEDLKRQAIRLQAESLVILIENNVLFGLGNREEYIKQIEKLHLNR